MATTSRVQAAVDEFGRRLDRHEEQSSKAMAEVNDKLDAIAREQRLAHGTVLGMLAAHGEKHVAADLKIAAIEKKVERSEQDKVDSRRRLVAWVLGVVGALIVGALGHLVGSLISGAR